MTLARKAWRSPKRPERYQLRVLTPEGLAHLTIERGYCTAADPCLAVWTGCSAAWIYGRLRFEGWSAVMLAEAPVDQGRLL